MNIEQFLRDFDFTEFAQIAGELLDAAGVVVIVGGAVFSIAGVVVTSLQRHGVHHTYRSFRQNLARSILLGLEFLVAGDIIRTVAGDFSLQSVGVLAIIVVIRTFLGLEFEMEIEGRWPWQRSHEGKGKERKAK